MKPLIFRCQVSNARPLLENIQRNITGWLHDCPDLEVVIRPHRSKRSIEQNKRLWKIYQTISEQVWVNGHKFDAETWHEYFKSHFIGYNEVVNPMTGEVNKIPLSTTTMNTQEMTEYQNKLQAWAANEYGILWEF